ncbi:MAG: 50S ribosomal protein L18e [Methanomicrobiales archaeon]|nr:50S ribosomal protein L18e [Methanomicrobiales archaeon]
MTKTNGKTNPRLTSLITRLKETSRKNDCGLWRDIADRLEAPSRNYAEVNVSKVSRYARDGETLIVPGKVLGTGIIARPVVIAALNFSAGAAAKIEKAEGTCLTIEELLKKNPKGNGIRILR